MKLAPVPINREIDKNYVLYKNWICAYGTRSCYLYESNVTRDDHINHNTGPDKQSSHVFFHLWKVDLYLKMT